MNSIRHSQERGHANHGWLDSRHTFSFANYHDPDFMGFGPLRVINEDRVSADKGFATHGHQDMEIISYVIKGALAHKDSMGNGSVIRPGDVQRMSAGTGVRHSEFNHSSEDTVHFLQIWIIPENNGLVPSYEERTFTNSDKQNQLRLVGSRDGRHGSVTVHQDADILASHLAAGKTVRHNIAIGRIGWLQMIDGTLEVGRDTVSAGDGLAISEPQTLVIEATSDAQFLLMDMTH